jgi:hypothetical protein
VHSKIVAKKKAIIVSKVFLSSQFDLPTPQRATTIIVPQTNRLYLVPCDALRYVHKADSFAQLMSIMKMI